MGKDNLLKCIEECKPHGFIGVPKAHLLRLAKRDLFKDLKFSVWVTGWPIPGAITLNFFKSFSSFPVPQPPVAFNDLALVAFTSGATGKPKGVEFTHSNIEAQLEIFATDFGLGGASPDNPLLDLPLLPIFSLFTLALGVGSVYAPLDPAKPLSLDPARIVHIIRDQRINFSFGSPTLWNKISEYCVRSATRLETLQRVFMAGAPVPINTLARLADLLPNGMAYTPYGATEALPVTLLSAAEILDRRQRGVLELPAKGGEVGTYVGHPVSGVELIVAGVSEQGELTGCAPFEIGEVLVTGRNISVAYLNNPSATMRAKVQANGKLWHRLGDLGYLDTDGGLYFCGRQVHAIVAPERTLYSIPVERIFNTDPRVRRSALIAVGGKPGLVVEPHPESWPESAADEQMLLNDIAKIGSSSPLTAGIQQFYLCQNFPVDARHNAKIFRDKLGQWADMLGAGKLGVSGRKILKDPHSKG
jgi:acyl-CoA synthetase (AMP-forming)/AMP-acid ligase II